MRVSAANFTQARRASFRYEREGVVALRCARGAAAGWEQWFAWAPAQDPRAVRVGESVIVLYSRLRLPRPIHFPPLFFGQATTLYDVVDFAMRNVSAPKFGAVRVLVKPSCGAGPYRIFCRAHAPKCVGRRHGVCGQADDTENQRKPWEKNWTPFVAPGGAKK